MLPELSLHGERFVLKTFELNNGGSQYFESPLTILRSQPKRIRFRSTFFLLPSGKRVNCPGFIKPDIFIKLVRQGCLEIMTLHLCLGPVNNTDRPFEPALL